MKRRARPRPDAGSDIGRRYDKLRRVRPRPSRDELMRRLALEQHRLAVRDDAYRRLITEERRARRRADDAEDTLAIIASILEHPSCIDDPEAVRVNVAAHVTAWQRARLDAFARATGDAVEEVAR